MLFRFSFRYDNMITHNTISYSSIIIRTYVHCIYSLLTSCTFGVNRNTHMFQLCFSVHVNPGVRKRLLARLAIEPRLARSSRFALSLAFKADVSPSRLLPRVEPRVLPRDSPSPPSPLNLVISLFASFFVLTSAWKVGSSSFSSPSSSKSVPSSSAWSLSSSLWVFADGGSSNSMYT